jgi:pimeloyl-ACP methyl ester carboxylesterase
MLWLVKYACMRTRLGTNYAYQLTPLPTDKPRGRAVKASPDWLDSIGAEFSPEPAITGYAHLTKYTVEYCEWGDGPPLVLVPGLAGGTGLLGPLARCLAPHFRVISYQLRGEDDCFALRRPFELVDLTRDLAEFLDWHCLESPTIFGVSFGGVLALEFAARFPHRVQELVVQGAGVRFEQGLLQRVAGTVLSRVPLPTDSPFINQFFNVLFGSPQKESSLFQFVTRQCWRTDQSVMAHRFRLAESFDISGRLGRIQAPTLVLAGRRDILVSERSLRELCGGIADAELVRLPDCGHLAFVTRPDCIAELVRRFAARSVGDSAAV